MSGSYAGLAGSDSPSFELRGEFHGFVRTLLGQRRLLLLSEGEEILLKVPKELRHLLQERLEPGQQIVAFGCREIEKRSGLPRLLVSKVQSASSNGGAGFSSQDCLVCPIRVCAKKNCWRSGGKELSAALSNVLAERGLAALIEVHAVQCLDDCDRAPNCEWNGRLYHRCSPRDARHIVAEVLQSAGV